MESIEQREVPRDPEREESFRLRSQYVIDEYLIDHPKSHLRELVGDQSITLEDAHKIMREANIDEKTELDNAKFTKYILNYEMAQSREKELPVSVAVIDIDDFKLINTELGHVEADRVLREVAQAMQDSIRVNDDVREHEPDQALSRWGGEEFVIVLPTVDAKQAHEIIDRIRVKIEQTLTNRRPSGKPITVTAGIAQYDRTRHGDASDDEQWKKEDKKLSWQRFLEDADQTVMDGKQIEKNKVYPEAAAA